MRREEKIMLDGGKKIKRQREREKKNGKKEKKNGKEEKKKKRNENEGAKRN